MVYRRLFVTLAVVSIIVMLPAVNIDFFYQQVRSSFETIKTLQADVAQTNEFTQTKTKLSSSGKLYYKPGNLVLDYAEPGIQKLLIKGNSVLIYDKNSKSVIKTTNAQGISNPLQIVDKYWSSSTKQVISEDTLSIKMRLIPANIDNLKKLDVAFDKTTKMLTELTYWDSSGNKVKYRFLNIRKDMPIPATKWIFTTPKGVKVIQR